LLISIPSIASDGLIGRWRLTKEFAATLPEVCRDAYVDVSEYTVTAFSGTQMLVAEYQASQNGSDYIVVFSNIKVNDEPNCQGIAPSVVKDNFATLQIWRFQGEKIKVLAPTLMMEIERT
jgi:hypothetical protein